MSEEQDPLVMAQTAALSIMKEEGTTEEEATLDQQTADERALAAEHGEQGEEKPAGEEEKAGDAIDWDKIKDYKRTLKVKADDGSDEEVELSLADMEKGVMLERSYRQKTAQIARERESLQTRIKEAVEPRLKEYDDKLALAEQVIWHTVAPELQSIDWNKLATENPAEWAQKSQLAQNVNTKLAQIQGERQKIAKQRADEHTKAMREYAAKSLETLQSEIPGWTDELYGKILKTGLEYGFKPDEVNGIIDHRTLKVLHDAMQFRALKAAKPNVDKKVALVPKVAKPGTSERTDPNADLWKDEMTNLQKSGGRDKRAAAALAKQILAREGIR